MARPQIRAVIPSIDEPIGHDRTGQPIYLPEPWRKFLELVSDALFYQGGDATQVLSEGGITLGTGTDGDYVESISGLTGVTVVGGTGEGSTPTVAIGQAVGTTDNVTFNSITVTTGINANTLGGQNSAFHLARSNHTGSQAIATITNLQTTLDGKVTKDASITAASESHAVTDFTETNAALDALGAIINEMRTAFNT